MYYSVKVFYAANSSLFDFTECCNALFISKKTRYLKLQSATVDNTGLTVHSAVMSTVKTRTVTILMDPVPEVVTRVIVVTCVTSVSTKAFLFGWLVGFLTSSSVVRLSRGPVPRLTSGKVTCCRTETERGDHDFCLSR